MNAVRSAAVGIAAFVTRHASPGWEEWLAGLHRETDFIESDWKALAWAAGSTRVLLDPRPAPIRTFRDLAEAAREFGEQRGRLLQRKYQHHIAPLFNLLYAGYLYLHYQRHATSTASRLGWGLLMLAMMTAAVLSWRRKPAPAPDADDLFALIQVYREHLRTTNGYAFTFVRYVVAGMGVAGVALAIALSPSWAALANGAAFLFLIAFGLVLFQLRRNAQSKLHQIDTLLAGEDTSPD